MPLAHAQNAPLLAVTQAGQRMIALGDHGVVILSDDGHTWRQAKSVPVDGLLTALSFVDAQQGWAVGHGGVLLKTDDGGETWTLLQRMEGQPVLLSVWFENTRHGIVVGAYGYAAQTEDGGQSWTRLSVGEEGTTIISIIFSRGPTTAFSLLQRWGMPTALWIAALHGRSSILESGVAVGWSRSEIRQIASCWNEWPSVGQRQPG